jgi:hypothetical protein
MPLPARVSDNEKWAEVYEVTNAGVSTSMTSELGSAQRDRRTAEKLEVDRERVRTRC